jgi:hypothetical protein
MEVEETTDFEVPNFEKHPLYDLPGEMGKHVVRMENAENVVCDFGSHFHGFGKGLIKGGNLCFQTRKIEDKEWTLLDFKVNTVARLFLERIIRHYSHNLNRGEAIPYHILEQHSCIEKVEVEDAKLSDPHFPKHILSSDAKCLKITVHPLGLIYIGNGAKGHFPNHSRHIVVQTTQQDLVTFHKILAVLGLQKVLVPNSPADHERMKIATLFRTFFPKEATRFERSNDLFTMGIANLKRHVIDLAPPMKMILNDYLPKMGEAEILPGRKRITTPVTDLLATNTRPLRLMTAMTGDDSVPQIANILKLGLLSQELRRHLELGEIGMSNEDDAEVGSDDSVFIQILSNTTEQFDGGYYSNMHIILSKEVLNTGTYQYFYDSFGDRVHANYENRPTIFELVNSLTKRHVSHEIMVKERIPPKFIEQIVVIDECLKKELIDHLHAKGLIENDTVLGKPLDSFIVTREEYDPSYTRRDPSYSSY